MYELFEAHLRKQPEPAIPETDVGRAAQQGFDNARRWLDGSALAIEKRVQ